MPLRCTVIGRSVSTFRQVTRDGGLSVCLLRKKLTTSSSNVLQRRLRVKFFGQKTDAKLTHTSPIHQDSGSGITSYSKFCKNLKT